MGHLIKLKDGSLHTVFSEHDLFSLIDEVMGSEVRRPLEELFEEQRLDYDWYEKEIDGLKKHHKDVMKDLDDASRNLAELISQKDLDRKAISNTAGAIRSIIYKENSKWD